MKKLLFFSIAMIIGILVGITSFFSFKLGYMYDLIDESIQSGDYLTVGRIFTALFDGNPAVSYGVGETNEKLIIYEATSTFIREGEDDDKTDLKQCYSIFLFDIANLKFDDILINETTSANYSGFVFGNGDLEYEYPFVSKEDGVSLVGSFKENNMLHLNLRKDDIDEKLNGKILSIRLLDSSGADIFDLVCDLDFKSEFYNKTEILISVYEKALENDDVDGFNAFYENWLNEYTEMGYKTGFAPRDLMPTIVYVKIFGSIFLYLAVVGVAAYFLFRRKIKA